MKYLILFFLHLLTVKCKDVHSSAEEEDSGANFMRHVISSCRNPRHVALTFDDGVGPYTGRLLDILREKRVRASFFILGNTLAPETLYSEHHKHVLVRMVREGHVIGSHSFSHPDLTDLSEDGIRHQMERTDELIQSVIGVKPRFMRPPYGYINHMSTSILRRAGYIIVKWNQDTNDWRHQENYRQITSFVKENIPRAVKSSEGPIVLQHDTLKSTIETEIKIIDILRKKGYEFVTLDECTGHLPYRV